MIKTVQELVKSWTFCCVETSYYARISVPAVREVAGGEEGYDRQELYHVELVYEDGVGVVGSYVDPEAWWVGKPDTQGNVFMKVPAEAIVGFLDETEAKQFWAMREAHDRLLSYAR